MYPIRKTCLFDIGKVLLDFDFESSLLKLIPEAVPNPAERIQQIMVQKDSLETGFLDPNSFADWSLRILESNATREQFYHAWRNIFTINISMWNCVRKLTHDGHRLILISNINAIHCPWIFETYPEFSLFENRVLSFEVGALKPTPSIYEYAINTYQLNPATTLYIDDQALNIAIGRAMGLQCWQYDLYDHTAFENWLETVLNTD